MKPHLIDKLAIPDTSRETQRLIQRYREIVKPEVFKKPGGKWKKYHEPENLEPEKLQVEKNFRPTKKTLGANRKGPK